MTSLKRAVPLCTAALLATIAAIASCSRHSEQTSTQAAAIVAPLDDGGFASTSTAVTQMQEPSGDFVNDRIFVGGFNTSNAGGKGWFVATNFNGTIPFECDFLGTNLVDGGSCPKVPIPVSSQIPTDADGGEIWDWAGDPTVRADGKGNFVYIGLGNGTTDTTAAHFVFASVSSKGGASFDSTVLVNDSGCGSGGFSQTVDQPNAVFDYTTDPPTLWVVYRNLAAGSQSIAGACIRRGVIDKGGGTAVVHWLEDARIVEGMGGSGFDVFPYTYGLGVAAGDGVVTVMYNVGTAFLPKANSKNAHNDPCPDDNPDFNGMAWATVDSFDNAHTWVDNSKIFHTEHSQWCVLGESPNTRGGSLPTVGQVLMGFRSFALARAPGGILYSILQDTRHSARLFMSPAAGTKGFSSATSTIRTWYEWCPGTPTSNVPGGPTANWKTTGVDNPDQPPCASAALDTDPGATSDGGIVSTGLDLVWPHIAVDGRGNLAISNVQDVRGGSSPIINYALRGITNPQVAGAFLQAPAFVRPVGFALPNNGFTRPLGDYTWIAVRPQGTAFRPPGCTTTNDFFPMWTADDGSGNPLIITRGFSITPP